MISFRAVSSYIWAVTDATGGLFIVDLADLTDHDQPLSAAEGKIVAKIARKIVTS